MFSFVQRRWISPAGFPPRFSLDENSEKLKVHFEFEENLIKSKLNDRKGLRIYIDIILLNVVIRDRYVISVIEETDSYFISRNNFIIII